MPQMNPISWVLLFLIFSLIFLLTNTINYFYPNKFKTYNNNSSNSYKSNAWKW